MNTTEKSNYGVNDLARFSPWPARLLGLEPWEQRQKTPQEIVREYEDEKWGRLLKKVRNIGRNVTVEETDAWALKDISATLCCVEEKLELLSAMEAQQLYKKIAKQIIEPYLPASALVELGAGYGTVILDLAKRNRFAQMRIMAGEYTASGIELMKILSDALGLTIELGHCDFSSPNVVDMIVPENAVIFTSFATACLPKLTPDFVMALSTLHPKIVIHIEPCYEHCDNTSLLGLMRRRYIEVNDYNTNLVSILHEQQKRGFIEILEERPLVFGMNPLLTASVLVWTNRS